MIRLTKSQRRKMSWLLLGRKANDEAAAETPLSSVLRGMLGGNKPADPSRVGELVDLLYDLEDQARHPDTGGGKAASPAVEIEELTEEEIRARFASAAAVKVHVDGASKGNPGPGGIGAAFLDGSDKVLHQVAQPIGTATNNEAEYRAVIAGLEEALRHGLRRITVFTDSRLMAGQMTGEFAVKTRSLLPFVRKAVDLRKRFDFFEIHAVPREKNQLADALSNVGVAMNEEKNGDAG